MKSRLIIVILNINSTHINELSLDLDSCMLPLT
jgi:hypothetical protein